MSREPMMSPDGSIKHVHRRAGRHSRAIVLLPALCLLAACYKNTEIEGPYDTAIAETAPEQIRVTIAEDSTFLVSLPAIEGETIVGQARPCRAAPELEGPCRSSFDLEEISLCEVRTEDSLASVAIVGGTVAALGVAVGLVVTSGYNNQCGRSCRDETTIGVAQ